MTQTECIKSVGYGLGRMIFAYTAVVMAMALVMVIMLSSPVFAADDSPHGHFTSSTDKCKSCHRVHGGSTASLLPEQSITQTCVSCHSNGSGADTGVMQGAYFEAGHPGHSWGTDGGTLVGGGFSLVGNSAAVTGSHQLDVAGKPYGTTTGVTYVLTCVSCHTPHEGPNYRLLRRNVADSPTDIRVTSNELDKNYCVTDYGTAPGIQEYTRNYESGIAAWCTACHAKYMTRGGTFGKDIYDAGDMYGTVERYRHAIDVPITGRTDTANGLTYDLATNLPLQDLNGDGRTDDDTLTCLTCHQAHGSAAQMHGAAVLPAAKRGTLPQTTNGMLLRQNDRIMCRDCHNMT